MTLRDRGGAGSLVAQVGEAIRRQILAGDYPAGARLPSEAQLTELHGVSRTVVREAIAALRADGLVQPRQGSGVFVLDFEPQATFTPLTGSADLASISSIVEVLEIRIGIEVEAAALAALRRSPAQEEQIILRHDEIGALMEAGKPTSGADFALHLAVADATNNPRFREFLEHFGQAVIPRAALQGGAALVDPAAYISQIDREHGAIVAAISDGEEDAAREAMRLHLRGSQARYRALLRQARRHPGDPQG
jgi:GntR family transcriptional repressor for pyruvate dehydrogenase complex